MHLVAKTKRPHERGALTIIELFPLFIAVTVTVGAGFILSKHYGDSGIVWLISAFLGAGSWVLYAVVILKKWRR